MPKGNQLASKQVLAHRPTCESCELASTALAALCECPRDTRRSLNSANFPVYAGSTPESAQYRSLRNGAMRLTGQTQAPKGRPNLAPRFSVGWEVQ